MDYFGQVACYLFFHSDLFSCSYLFKFGAVRWGENHNQKRHTHRPSFHFYAPIVLKVETVTWQGEKKKKPIRGEVHKRFTTKDRIVSLEHTTDAVDIKHDVRGRRISMMSKEEAQ